MVTKKSDRKREMLPFFLTIEDNAMNTFVPPSISGISPFESVSVRKPPGLLNLMFSSLEQFATTYKNYQQLLKEKGAITNTHFHGYKTRQVQESFQCINDQKVIFSKGGLVYLLPSQTSSLPNGKNTFHQVYLCPIASDTVLDSTHYKWRDLENRGLEDSFHINSLRQPFVPTQMGTVTTQMQLYKGVYNVNYIDYSKDIEHLTRK